MTNFSSPSSKDSLHSLPEPAKGRGGVVKLGMVTLAVLLITGAGLYWLTRDEKDQEKLTESVRENVQSVVKNTPLHEVVTPLFNKENNAAKKSVTSPSTAPGTLAGQHIQGHMSTPPSASSTDSLLSPADILRRKGIATSSGAENPPTPANSQDAKAHADAAVNIAPAITPVLPKVQEDEKVPADFVEDMSAWLMSRYNPKKGLNLSLSSANLRYGQKMRTLMPQELAGKGDIHGARAELLRYAFNSSMMTALYNLYSDRLVQGMAAAAQKPYKGEQVAQPQKVLEAFSKEFETLGSVLQGIGALPDFEKRMQAIDASVQETLRIHTELTEAIFAFDTAIEEKKNDVAETIQLRIDSINAQYQRSIHNRTLATEALIASVRKKSPAASRVQGDTILFISQWLERRINKNTTASDVAQSATTAGALLQNLSGKLQKAL